MKFDPNDHMMNIERFDKRLNRRVTSKYLEVKWRLVWFRELHPDYLIHTRPGHIDAESAWFIAEILDQNKTTLSTGHGYCRSEKWERHVEKAETTAIGRALALLGIGTQFAIELDEEVDEFADTPVEEKQKHAEEKKSSEKIPLPKPSNEKKPLRTLSAIYRGFKAHGFVDDVWRKLLQDVGVTPDPVTHSIARLDNLEAKIREHQAQTGDDIKF